MHRTKYATHFKNDTIMNTVTYRKRTREEITAWLNQARQRKESWEKETEQELKEIFSDR